MRVGAGLGGGSLAELSRHWRIDDARTLGLGATAWALVGRDQRDWLNGDFPLWNILGGALVASVAMR